VDKKCNLKISLLLKFSFFYFSHGFDPRFFFIIILVITICFYKEMQPFTGKTRVKLARSERLKLGALPPGFHWQVYYPQFKGLEDGTVLTYMPISKMKMKEGEPDKADTDFIYNHFICKLNPLESMYLICEKRVATGGNDQVSNCQRHIRLQYSEYLPCEEMDQKILLNSRQKRYFIKESLEPRLLFLLLELSFSLSAV